MYICYINHGFQITQRDQLQSLCTWCCVVTSRCVSSLMLCCRAVREGDNTYQLATLNLATTGVCQLQLLQQIRTLCYVVTKPPCL